MDIDVNYELKITGLHTTPAPIKGFSSIITRIDWSLTASSDIDDINHIIKKIGSTFIDFTKIELTENNFINYSDLTEQQIVSWVEEIDEKFLETLKTDCKNEIINFLFKTTNQTRLPWVSVSDDISENAPNIISLNDLNDDLSPQTLTLSRQPQENQSSLETIPNTMEDEVTEETSVGISSISERILPIPPFLNPPDSELIPPVDPVTEEPATEQVSETP